ncbi:hypothetical protein OEA41_007883 [Lepraria neglecta]|uniref:Aminoglycoside phosphotransferase domain-containing protein n=1 Tax=Lepraria neglecta TaxID=209136 RepID=A0AAD9ZGH6_9LECA|nr:hypothetical protein OEA41_007883 [Lepraria neglecta]
MSCEVKAISPRYTGVHDSDDEVRFLSRAAGAHVVCHDNNLVLKSGQRVRCGEEHAMRLVEQHTNVPVPRIIFSSYLHDGKGEIGMNFIPGCTLGTIWDRLDVRDKERLCHDIWSMISQWRQIIRPPHLAHLYQCLADGSPATPDPLLKDLDDPRRPLYTDEAVRARIHQRYLHYFGRRFADTLPGMLPRSKASVFTHGDIAPRNIMVDQSGHITSIIDWELAGWYPDYWEYANIMKPSMDHDWQSWMDRTATQQ